MSEQQKPRVLVTGSSRGIGAAIALELQTVGFAVTIHGRTKSDRLLELAEKMGSDTEVLTFDVADRASAEQALTNSIKTFGPYYGVVCNAGITNDVPFPAMESASWDNVIQTNLGSFYNVIHPLVMPMIQTRRGGRIVTISSLAGVVGNRGQVSYSASKAGIIGATRSLSLELAKRKISVNCIAPGLIDTDMTAHLPTEEATKAIPMQRAGRPEEVAGLVSYLFSPRAEYITGQVISINGGLG